MILHKCRILSNRIDLIILHNVTLIIECYKRTYKHLHSLDSNVQRITQSSPADQFALERFNTHFTSFNPLLKKRHVIQSFFYFSGTLGHRILRIFFYFFLLMVLVHLSLTFFHILYTIFTPLII